jgi:MFS family permease
MTATIQKVFFPPTASAAVQLLSYWGIFAGMLWRQQLAVHPVTLHCTGSWGSCPADRLTVTPHNADTHLCSHPSALTIPLLAVGFVTRPIGALAFGHLGDTRGRGTCLLLSVIFMGVPKVIISCLPTYAQAGAVAPALLALMRLIQGLAMGGEFGGYL